MSIFRLIKNLLARPATPYATSRAAKLQPKAEAELDAAYTFKMPEI